jgi:hypothetical protein
MKLLIPVLNLKVHLFMVQTYYRHCVRDIFPTMLEFDESRKGTIEEQMFYNRKSLKEIIELRYCDVKKKVCR